MDRILEKEELEKLNSTDGIIEILCGIPNFKSEMYNQLDKEKKDLIDYTMSIDLISNRQIERNLRRSLDSENLALLEKRKLIALSLLYFGKKDDTGKYVTYTCPYTGKEYNISEIERELEKKQSEKDDNKRLELEHIMPHSGGGGTVLFNCLLSSVEANGKGEKGNRHLIDWFSQSDYYDFNRLNRIVCYMLSAYSIAYNGYKKNALEFNYEFVDGKEENTDNNELETIRKEKTKSKQKNETKIEGYKIYLDQLVNKLKEDNYDTTEIDKKIKVLEEDGIFKTNNKYELVQRIVEDIFQERTSDTSYLTNSLKVDYYRLVDSIKVENEKEIESEIKARIEIIKGILEKTNKSMKDYYISMKDIEDIDILYIPTYKISDNDKGIFEESIKLSPETKINILLEMLRYADEKEFQELLNKDTAKKITFKFYKKDENGKKIIEKDFNVTIGQFWQSHKDELLDIIYKKEQYEGIREKLDDYYIRSRTAEEGVKRRIEIFLEMLKCADQDEFQELLKQGSNITFKIYKKDEIGNVIKDANRKKVIEKDFNVTIGPFWKNNKDDKLIPLLFYNKYYDAKENIFVQSGEDYSGKEYDIVRDRVLKYLKVNRIEEYMNKIDVLRNELKYEIKINIFLEMLKNADKAEFQELLNKNNNLTFKIYKKDENGKIEFDEEGKKVIEKDFNVTIGQFWQSQKDTLLDIIYKEEQYEDIREKLDDYYLKTDAGARTNEGAKRRRKIFLEMLKNAEQEEFQELLKFDSNLTFKTYKKDENGKRVVDKDFNVTVRKFWDNIKDDKLIPLLFYNKYYDAKKNEFVQSGEDYSGEEYDIVRERVLKYLKVNRIEDYMNTEKYINRLKSKSNKANKLGNMIELVEDLINKKERLIEYREEKLEDNISLKEKLKNSILVTQSHR